MRIMDDETQLKVRKFLKRLGISSQQELNQFIENNPDVQDLSIKVSFEINDKHVFEWFGCSKALAQQSLDNQSDFVCIQFVLP